jgi:hypothetical protein
LRIYLESLSHIAKKLNSVFVALKFKKTLINSCLDFPYITSRAVEYKIEK